MTDPPDLLSGIHGRLAQGATVAHIIQKFLPNSHAEAVAYGRRLPLWDEYWGQFSPQVVALARVLSRRGMRQFGLHLDGDDYVTEESPHRSEKVPSRPRLTFPLPLDDEEVRVEYVPHYFPNSDQDLFAFISPHQPPQPHPLSQTGYWSHFTSHDAVAACGGPEAYAALLVEARLRGDRSWDALFDGVRGEPLQPRRKRGSATPAAPPERAVPAGDAETRQASGPHSTRILAELAGQEGITPAQAKPEQGFLF